MTLPIAPPLGPMEALSVATMPVGKNWQYELKWDGFRCLTFRDGDRVDLQAKSGRPLTRYFPELVDAVRRIEPLRFVLDGEIVVPIDHAFSFDALLQRIHPAASRVKKLAAETPARLIVFDLLVGERWPLVAGPAIVGAARRIGGFLQGAYPDHKPNPGVSDDLQAG